MDIINFTDFTEKFTCNYCDIVCSRASEWSRHLLTRKHLDRVNGYHLETIGVTEKEKKEQKKQNKQKKQYNCANCEKVYLTNGGLWKHRKICMAMVKSETPVADIKLLTTMVMDLMKSNNELQQQMMDMCKHSNNTINSHNNHSNNKTFNLQFFLNEQCKDAMNMSDFVNTFELQLADLESVGELGYVEGISKIIVERLNTMDIYKRPMHCSDAKRETLYIKDEDRWEKEAKHNPKLRKAIQTVSFKNMKLVNTWSDAYPESKNSESRLNDKYMKLIKQSTGGNGEAADNEDKIIRRIAKEVVIEK